MMEDTGEMLMWLIGATVCAMLLILVEWLLGVMR